MIQASPHIEQGQRIEVVALGVQIARRFSPVAKVIPAPNEIIDIPALLSRSVF